MDLSSSPKWIQVGSIDELIGMFGPEGAGDLTLIAHVMRDEEGNLLMTAPRPQCDEVTAAIPDPAQAPQTALDRRQGLTWTYGAERTEEADIDDPSPFPADC